MWVNARCATNVIVLLGDGERVVVALKATACANRHDACDVVVFCLFKHFTTLLAVCSAQSATCSPSQTTSYIAAKQPPPVTALPPPELQVLLPARQGEAELSLHGCIKKASRSGFHHNCPAVVRSVLDTSW